MPILRRDAKTVLSVLAVVGLVSLLVLITATVALARSRLEYAEGVEPRKGISFMRVTATADQVSYAGRTARVRVEQAAPVAPAASGDVWGRLRNCESSDGRSSASGRYHGYFQFDQQTWNSVGGSGNPGAASYDEQLMRAKMLQARRGWGPWPACSKALGLR